MSKLLLYVVLKHLSHDCVVCATYMFPHHSLGAVFEPLIDRVCDPDWINQRLVAYLRQQQAAEELHRRTYMYAASYEDFITLIHDSTDVHDLEHLR